MHKIDWLDNLQHKTTGFRSIQSGQKMACVGETDMELRGNYKPNEGVEYVMMVEVGALYRLPVGVKPHEHANIFKETRRQLSREIFREVLCALDQIENYLNVGELEEAYKEIKDIRDQINY